MVAYWPRDGCGLQSTGRRKSSKAARSVAQEQRADTRPIVRAPRHDAAGRNQASPVAGSGQPGRRRLARAREAALPQSSADSRDLRALDWEIRAPSPSGVERFEKGSRTKQNQQERVTLWKNQS